MSYDLKREEAFDPAFLDSIVKQIGQLLHPAGSGVYLYYWDKKELLPAAQYNLPQTPLDPQLLKKVLLSRKLIKHSKREQPSFIGAPLVQYDITLGVLVAVDENAERLFNDQDIDLLLSMADHVALVLQQAERLSRMTAQFRALHDIDIALTPSLELDRVLELILEKAVDLVGAESGSLRQIEPDTGNLDLKAHLGSGWTPEALAFIPEKGIVRWVAEHKCSYLCRDLSKDPQNIVLFEGMRSSVAVPLLVGHEIETAEDELLGVLLLESSKLAAFDQQDVELLEALAQEAVIAIQNATQHQELHLMHKKYAREQERRVAAEKWAVMGQAATALAHRINNIMGIVPASAGEVKRTLSGVTIPLADRDWIDQNLKRIERNSRFILKLSESLFRPFKESGPPIRFNVNLLLNEAIESADLPVDVQVICKYTPIIPEVESNSLLVDIFVELITNARKAMQDLQIKRLVIRTRKEVNEDGDWVVVEISDTGCGIPSKKMKHLWGMFQLSRGGLGFGLWWLRTFVERQGGTIECQSQQGKGSTFRVRLPAFGDGSRGDSPEEGD
jgi:signal transduction histidine kinase